MNTSKKDIWQIIKQAVLLSEKPTKKDVSVVIFMHALMIALMLVCAFLRIPFVWLIGAFWFIYMAQGFVVGLTDNSERYIWQVVNQVFRRTISPTKSDKSMAIVVSIIAFLIFLGFFIVALASNVLWLLGGAFYGPVAVLIAAQIWRVWNIARQVKAQRPREETA